MGKFKVGDKVIPSKRMLELCGEFNWPEIVKAKVEDDGYLVISEIYGKSAYMVEGLPTITFLEEWLEPYIEQGPLTLLTEDGLSVRDRFAMAALMCYRADLFTAPEYVAEKAYKVADAMMEVRHGDTVQ